MKRKPLKVFITALTIGLSKFLILCRCQPTFSSAPLFSIPRSWAFAIHARMLNVLVDEAQFLTKDQVWQLARLADDAGIPVLCYGLRTDFQGELFAGSAALLGLADALIEMKAVCDCGRKATMNLRVDARGDAVIEGAQTEIGGNDRYVAMCRKHFRQALAR